VAPITCNYVTDGYGRDTVILRDDALLGVKAQHPCHEKANVSPLASSMSKAPKRPRHRDDRNQDNGESGAPNPKASASTRKPRSAPKRKADPVVDTKTMTAAGDSPEVSITSSLSPEQGLLPKVYDLSADSISPGEDQQRSRPEIRDGAAREEQAVALAETLHQGQALQEEESNLHQSPLRIESGVEQEPVQARHPPMADEFKSGNRANDVNSLRPDREEETTGEWPSHIQAVPAHGRKASGRVKVWTGELAAHREQSTPVSDQGPNPIYILVAITLGVPTVILVLLVGMNSGMQDGAFMTLVTLLVLSAVVIAVVLEIKRFVDHPSDSDTREEQHSVVSARPIC
jgi:hypothetical protein